MEVKDSWYQDWFDEDYLRVYSHRTSEEAVRFVQRVDRYLKERTILSETPSHAPKTLLDIACGAGRHAGEFAKLGWSVTGIDLSETLLEQARKNAPSCQFVRADMRSLPFTSSSFDVAISAFTSFGYFASDDEHRCTLREWRRVFRTDGYLVLDYLNKQHTIDHLVPEDRTRRDDLDIHQQRTLSPDQTTITKYITLTWSDGRSRSVVEQLMLYSQTQLEQMLAAAGFSGVTCWGDYEGQAFHKVTSPRCILVMQAKSS